MKNGIGPQSLGASGMSPNSKPCGTPLDFNAGLRAAEKAGKLPESFAKEVRADSPNNSGSPLYFQDDLAAIQGAVSTLEKHNMTGGGGGAQPAAGGAAASQKEMLMSSMQQGPQGGPGAATMRGLGGLFGRLARRR